MADPKQLEVIRQGVEAWNLWRKENPEVIPNLCRADLGKVDLRGVNFRGANLSGTNLSGASLDVAEIVLADGIKRPYAYGEASHIKFNPEKYREAIIKNLPRIEMDVIRVRMSDLREANLSGANLAGANLLHVMLSETIFGNTQLREARGLTHCQHNGPSILDYRTLAKSGPLPLSFLRGCGLPDKIIDYLPSLLLNEPIQFYSCFISYSTKDQDFADRVHADLQNKGVRCWFAPHDIKGGKKIREQIDEAIRLHDRLLLILSEHSMKSEWVETEIAAARKREVREQRRMLFPVRLVQFEALRDWECFDADTGKDSAREIREYYVPDFSNWKQHDAYQVEFDKLLKALKPEPAV